MKTKPNDPISVIVQKTANSIIGTVDNITNTGLTKREHFAAMAMQGMVISGAQTEHGGRSLAPTIIAEYAVMQADELIKALNKQ